MIYNYLNNTNIVWGGIYWDRLLEKRLEDSKYLEQFGYKVYSQNDEDGIIHEIFNRIGEESKRFIEFGVDRGLESNCHALLLQGWKGLWIEGNESSYVQILRRFAPVIREGRLNVYNNYVTRDNAHELLSSYLKNEELDLLSIDVDGNDWHIWKALRDIRARVVIIEYNGKFAPEINWKMAYNPEHSWDRSDMQGASLKALELLGREQGYQLVGTNICGINAFFVREDLAKDYFVSPATAENLYNPARMNMLVFANGHPSKNYVGTTVEGIEGIFEYYPDWNYLPTVGFHNPVVINEQVCCVMKDYIGKVFLRNIPASTERIEIYYDNAFDNENVEVKCFENCDKHLLAKGRGKISIETKNVELSAKYHPVVFKVDNIETITTKYFNEMKLQGLAIYNIEYI